MSRRGRRLAAAATACTLLAICSGSARAQSEDEPDRSFRLSGDWGGLRTRLRDDGWTFQAREKFEAAANASGGDRKAGVGAGELRLGLTADLEKIAGIPDGEIQLTFTERHGASLAPHAGLDLLQPAVAVHGRGDQWRLTQFWYRQSFAHGNIDLRAGRLNPGTDFDALPCNFQNLTFCGSQPGNLVGDYWYNWPVSQWGLRVKHGFSAGYLEAGAYQVNPKNLTDELRLSFAGGKGVLVPVEAAWTPKIGSKGLPGTYRLGGWYSTTKGEDVLLGVDGAPKSPTGAPALKRAGQYGAYFAAEQQVTGRADGPGVSVFLHMTQADRRTARLDRQAAFGVAWSGVLASRPKDVLALGVGVTHVNDRASRSARLAGKPAPGSEYAAELDYRLHGPKGLTVTPNLQLVKNPGGLDRKTALIFGVKLIVGL